MNSRIKRVIAASLANGTSRFVGLVVSLATTPILLASVGDTQFGIWASLVSLFSSLVFADLGLGNGLITPLATAASRGEFRLTQNYISSAILLLCLAATVIAAMMFAVLASGGIGPILNLNSPDDIHAAARTAVVIGLSFAIGLPLTLIAKVRLALQDAAKNAPYDVLAQALIIGSVYLCYVSHAKLHWFAIAISSPPLLAAAVHWIIFRHSTSGVQLLPTFAPSRSTTLQLCKVGLVFLVLQLGSAALVAIDAFLAARWDSPAASAEIAIAQRLFSIPPLICGLAWTPLWSAFADAYAVGDWRFIKRTLGASLSAAIAIATITTIGLLWLGEWPFRAWIGHNHALPGDQLIQANIAWCALAIACGPIAMLLNGLGKMRIQIISTLAMLALAIPLKYLLFLRFGPAGLVWASVLSLTLCVIAPWFWYIPWTLRKHQK